MANIKVKDADAANKYLAASGAGSDVDPHVAQHEVIQSTAADLNVTEASAADIKTAVEAIQTAVEVIDNMISGSEAQVDVVSSALPTGAATEATLAAIQTAVELIDNMIAGSEAQVDVVSSALPTGAATEATLAAIQTAVELIDNMIAGSEAQVDVVASLPAGSNQIGDVVVNDVEDGAGTSAMDAVNHALKVNVVAGSSGGVSHTDDAAFTSGSDDVVPAAGTYQSSPDTVDDGDAGALRMTQRRALLVSHETPAGDSMVDDVNDALQVNVVAGSGSGVSHTDDAAFTPGTDDVVPAAGVYQSSPDSVDDGDAGALRMTADRALIVDATAKGDVPITLDSEVVAVDATGQGDVPVTLDSEVVAVDATGQGDVPITLAGEVVSIDDNAGSLTVDGTVTAQLSPQTSGGLSIFRSIDLDESEEAVKASAGQLFGFFLYNLATATRYIKFYNDTVANVTVGTTTPVLTIPLDADQGATVEFTNGIAFSTAITLAATTGVADNDTGAPGANEVIANVFYK